MIADWAEKYVNIPYKLNGRDYGGCDCYGLVCIIYKDSMGLILPSLAGSYSELGGSLVSLYEDNKGNWQQVDSPLIGDVVYFNVSGFPVHVGVYVGDNCFIHNIKNNGSSSIGDVTHAKWKHRLIGYWRYDNSSA